MSYKTPTWQIRYGGDSPMGSLRNDPAVAFLKALGPGWTVQIETFSARPEDPEHWDGGVTLLGEYLGLVHIGGEECIEMRESAGNTVVSESAGNAVVYIPLVNVIDIFIP